MSALRTTYEFTLPRGYVDDDGQVHRTGTMRLATARDELEPLRDPRVTGPDDPRLTVLVLARVISKLGSLPQVTMHEIEGLFAVDLAYLQDFYGVINFGNQAEFDALVQAQLGTQLVVDQPSPERAPAPETTPAPAVVEQSGAVTGEVVAESRPTLRHAVEELPRKNG
ncbi:hypothetical protein RB608_01060 [Nocardioides sp. LHD-245]|uniref:hypothetical protein n=1 Tax=Nocardioides sp. LHD-245 TaxID=3051387 RepID=UPI0027DEB721|nr:hypothetical protein [Nocardioides sp. LHD-245]